MKNVVKVTNMMEITPVCVFKRLTPGVPIRGHVMDTGILICNTYHTKTCLMACDMS